MLHSAVAAASKGGNADMSHVKQLLDFIWPPLIEALGKEPDVDVLPATLDAVSSIVDMVEPGMIQQEWVQVRVWNGGDDPAGVGAGESVALNPKGGRLEGLWSGRWVPRVVLALTI